MYGEETAKADIARTIESRCGSIAELVDQAHKVLTELEARISPVLQQEDTAPSPDSNVRAMSYDASAVVSQHLGSIELRMQDLISRIHRITLRSEV